MKTFVAVLFACLVVASYAKSLDKLELKELELEERLLENVLALRAEGGPKPKKCELDGNVAEYKLPSKPDDDDEDDSEDDDKRSPNDHPRPSPFEVIARILTFVLGVDDPPACIELNQAPDGVESIELCFGTDSTPPVIKVKYVNEADAVCLDRGLDEE